MEEPRLRVGLVLGAQAADLTLDGPFDSDVRGVSVPAGVRLRAEATATGVRLAGPDVPLAEGERIRMKPGSGSTFTLHGMTVGVQFHWQHQEDLRFRGRLVLEPDSPTDALPTLRVVNEVLLEDYLVSVVSSEMSATCPPALLRAHAVISRSWLVSQLEARGRQPERPPGVSEAPGDPPTTRILRWYDRQQHDGFDVCADDHCQRYQGVTRAFSAEARAAVEATRGVFLVHGGRVCDARFSKCCGGRTEIFPAAWGTDDPAYLRDFADTVPAPESDPALDDEARATAFLLDAPPAFCNTTDADLLARILPHIDHGTPDFYRWEVSLGQAELQDLLRRKLGVETGPVRSMTAVSRGPSGRITCLEIVGTARRLLVGKELEIRRALSPTHLYSSAFVIRLEGDEEGVPARFVLRGGGWGHGVGLCQIGAAVMAAQGFDHEAILAHYYRGASLERRY